HDVAIATKEVLVAEGKLVTGLYRENKVNLLPIDSEHSALFQALQDTGAVPRCVSYRFPEKADTSKLKNIRQLILTASGGPFASRKDVDFDNITVGEALNHPRWAMGPKVTIDSATMMNKGLEILEAKWLFDIPAENISVLVHPESIVHSLVEFADGAQMAQLGYPDMRLPIQYAMTWPERVANDTLPRLDLALASTLNFSNPDYERFPCLRLAENAAGAGGLVPTAMNAANEMAVESFLEGKIKFSRIWEIVERVMWEFETEPEASTDELDKIIDADARARISAGNLINAR
ncbi:MAG: 1-deoxy-D-xylulose-5-phosphate reductoisomerase, partial [Lentisphaerae bacterium]|nr:1-deoxy-D-xylulose-5-phosphate reductoisomerase [Lentisphaerota bacterium]